MVELAIKIIEIINIAFTAMFILIFSVRLCHLRHFALTERYTKHYPKVRILLAIIYILLGIAFLIYSIATQQFGSNVFLYIFAGGGECIDSVILLLQLWVLRRQLIKQRPYTATHLVFSIYLTLISIVRFGVVLTKLTRGEEQLANLLFYLAFMIDSILLLGYWIAKRQELPQFEDHQYFNFEEFQNDSSRFMMNRNIEISYLKKISDSFNYIRPTVTVEKSKFRILLEVFVDREQTDEKEDEIKKVKKTKALEVISNSIYSIGQIKELYKICGRFDIKQRLNFQEIKMFEMYQNLQNYLEEIFNQKHYYIEEVLQFFDIPKSSIQTYTLRLRDSIQGSEFDMTAHLDKNATLVSVRIYKQLWIQDHYLFYMDVFLFDGREESRPMKRYTDFEIFHENLQSIIRKKYNNQYVLPQLPKKHLFYWDQSKINQRRFQLERYLRELTNDHELMLKAHSIKEAVFHFLNFRQLVIIHPISIVSEDFFDGIEIFKGQIGKALIGNDYVTFYEFKIFKKGLLLRVLRKRFSDFIYLHDALQRWMLNTQITYKIISLPEKHLYKSEHHRHEKLKNYIVNVASIKDISKVYTINSFFNVGSDTHIDDLSFSGIEIPEKELQKKRQKTGNMVSDESPNRFGGQKYIPSPEDSSFSSNQRMSALIQELGN